MNNQPMKYHIKIVSTLAGLQATANFDTPCELNECLESFKKTLAPLIDSGFKSIKIEKIEGNDDENATDQEAD